MDHIAYNRLLISVADINQVYAQLSAGTQIVFISSLCPNDQAIDTEQAKQLGFSGRDVDGIYYDIMQAAHSQRPGLSGVVVNCASLNKTRDWYIIYLGLTAIAGPRDLTLPLSRYQSHRCFRIWEKGFRLTGYGLCFSMIRMVFVLNSFNRRSFSCWQVLSLAH